jgi:uncharacterized UBP type Zn finger protein
MFTILDMNREFECNHCGELFRNLPMCPCCGNPTCRLVRYGVYGNGPPFVATSIDKPTFVMGHRNYQVG